MRRRVCLAMLTLLALPPFNEAKEARSEMAQTRAISVRGTVSDGGTGAPVGGARVTLASRQGDIVPGSESTSASDGTFVLVGPEQSRLLIVEARGYAVYRRSLADRELIQPIIIGLDRAASVQGTIIGAATNARLPAKVLLVSRHPRNTVSIAQDAPAGVFEVDGLLPAPTLIVARSSGFAPAVASLVVKPGERVGGVQIPLRQAASIRGYVITAGGQPIGGADVEIHYELPFDARNALESLVGGQLRTGSDGWFWLKNVSPGIRLVVEVRRADRSVRAGPLTLGDGEQLELGNVSF